MRKHADLSLFFDKQIYKGIIHDRHCIRGKIVCYKDFSYMFTFLFYAVML